MENFKQFLSRERVYSNLRLAKVDSEGERDVEIYDSERIWRVGIERKTRGNLVELLIIEQ
jgi:hypothetical protein